MVSDKWTQNSLNGEGVEKWPPESDSLKASLTSAKHVKDLKNWTETVEEANEAHQKD